MHERPLPLAAALSGLASIVLLFIGQAFGGGGSPDLNASRATITDWLARQHADAATYAGGTLELLGILAMVVFAATLWSVLRGGDDSDVFAATAFGAGLVSAAVKLASGPAVFAAVWRHDEGLNPQLGAVLVDMNNVSFVLTWTIDAVMLAAAATVILRANVLPRWLGWLAAATSVILIASAPAADLVPPVGILLTFVWIVGTSVVLTRRTLRPHARAAPAHA